MSLEPLDDDYQPRTSLRRRTRTVVAIYALFLASLLVGITSIFGVVLAHLNRDCEDSGLRSHYTFQIFTFWLSLLYAFMLAMTVVGSSGFTAGPILLSGAVILIVWFILRCCSGVLLATRGLPVANSETFGFWAKSS